MRYRLGWISLAALAIWTALVVRPGVLQAQSSATPIAYQPLWQIPRMVCHTADNCGILARYNQVENRLYLLNIVDWILYVYPAGTPVPTRYDLSGQFTFIAPTIDFLPVGDTQIVIYNGTDKLYAYDLSTQRFTTLAPQVKFRSCRTPENGSSSSISLLGIANTVLACFSTAVRGPFDIGTVEIPTGKIARLETFGSSTYPSSKVDWYRLLGGQDNNIYLQYMRFPTGTSPNRFLTIYRRTIASDKWEEIAFRENDLTDPTINNPASDQIEYNYDLVAVDSRSNSYVDYSWMETSKSDDLIDHVRIAKFDPKGQKVWSIAENLGRNLRQTWLGITATGQLVYLIENVSSSGPTAFEVNVALVQSTATPPNAVTQIPPID